MGGATSPTDCLRREVDTSLEYASRFFMSLNEKLMNGKHAWLEAEAAYYMDECHEIMDDLHIM